MKLIMIKNNSSVRTGTHTQSNRDGYHFCSAETSRAKTSSASTFASSSLSSGFAGRTNTSLKLVYLVIGGVCLMLGVIGLIIPIIPGVLFLMAALYLLSRGSRRIKSFSEGHPRLRPMHRRMEQFGEVDFSDRIRLGAWMMVEAGVKSVQVIKNGVVRAVRSVNRKNSSY